MFSRKRAISFLCAACMLCSLIIMVLPAPVYGTSLSEQLEQARQEKEALENQIKAIRADKNKVLQQKKLLDQRNETLRNEVNLIQKQADETQARIVDLTAKEEQQYALFCRQVGAGHGVVLVGDLQVRRLCRSAGAAGLRQRGYGL